MADAPTVRFIMHGARAAIAGGMLHIEEQVAGIERAVVENPGLAFDLAKTLIESACRTILAERRIAFDPGDDLPKLFKTASQNLPFLPISASGAAEIRKSLTQTLNGLHTAIQGICELRNQCGFASHGADGPRPALEAVQALLAAEAADTIIGFLHRVHQQDGAASTSSPSTYDDNPEFDNYVDEVHERVLIFDEEFEPSKILFELAPEPYRVYLTEFQMKEEDESGGTAGDDAAETAT
jgi:hypothetical protein